MKIVAIVSVIGILSVLANVGFIIYETLCMDFDFKRPWHDDNNQPEQTEVEKGSDSLNAQWKKKMTAASIMTYQEGGLSYKVAKRISRC